MSVLMLVLGIVVAAAGLVALGFGVRINEFSVGHTMIMSGTFAFAGGLVMIGLSAVIAKLARIARMLEAQPAARMVAVTEAGTGEQFQPSEPSAFAPKIAVPPAPPPVMAQPTEARPVEGESEPEPRPAETEAKSAADTVDMSASAMERLRSSLARPAKFDTAPPTKPKTAAPPISDFAPKAPPLPEADDLPLSPVPAASPPPSRQNGAGHGPRLDVAARNPSSAADALKNKRLDFLFRTRATRPAPGEQSEPPWPRRSGGEMQNGSQPLAERAAPPMAPAAAPAPRPEPPRAAAIIKSGVVDGMAYTLYADGSIEAQLPHGTVRFGSITELRSHIENNS